MKYTHFTPVYDRFDKHYFQFDKMERVFKTLNKQLHAFDRKFTAASPDLINQRVNSLTTELDAIPQTTARPQSPITIYRCLNRSYYTPPPQRPYDRIDHLDGDHQLLGDSLDALKDTITTTHRRDSNEPATNHIPITTLTATVVQTQEKTANLNRSITDLCARE